MSVIPLPRSCKVESSSFCIEGVCLAIINGEALVETKNGGVSRFNLYGVYSLTFMDR